MKKINKNLLILFGIVIISIILRFWGLSATPPSINWDEASLGYNAYSILLTGRDEYGKLFPIITQSLGDFKPALYIYLIIPFIKLIGLTEAAVRLPAAIFGVITVITTYFIVKELFKKESIALFSSFLLAISPWSIQFSRFASEAMVGLSLNLLMALFFLKGLKKPSLLILSAIFGALSLYVYQSEKIFVPLFALVLVSVFYKQIIKVPKKFLITSFIVGLVFALPILFMTFSDSDSLARARGTSFLNKPGGIYEGRLVERNLVNSENKDILGLVFDNRRVVYAKQIMENYLSHFDPNYLYVRGDINPRHKAPNMGQLYLFGLPFLLIGLYFLIFGNYKKESKIFILSWILIVPIAASLTWAVPHAIRTLNFLPTFQIITAIGLISAYEFIVSNKHLNKFRYLFVSLFLIFAGFNVLFYLNQYFVQYKNINSADWQYGYKQIVNEAEKLKLDVDKVVVSNEHPMDQSYIFFLFYTKFPPSKYQNRKDSSSKDFDKYEFKTIAKKDEYKNSIYIATPGQIRWDTEDNQLFEIEYLNGNDFIKIVKLD